MKKEFIPYEQALALKELGFNEECFGLYNPIFHIDYNSKNSIIDIITDNKKIVCSAPLYQQAFKWFRKKHGLEYHIKSDMIGYYTYIVDRNINKMLSMKNNIFQTYEEAELECLKKLIELCGKL